jgi:molybdenum cofactor cytidylyltransferase
MNSKPIGVLLAAGQSRRFGGNKLLQPILNNTPMLILSAEKLSSVLPGSLVVINSQLIGLTSQLEQLGLHVVVNEQAEQGMGSSIAYGVRASESLKPGTAGWLILLADMPYIETRTIELLINQLEQGAKLVAPIYRQQRGHPVGFNQSYKMDLLALNQDTGARDILNRYSNHLQLIEVEDEGILIDIDRPNDILAGTD